MPNDISLHLNGVWSCVGFFTGAGWTLANWFVYRLLRKV